MDDLSDLIPRFDLRGMDLQLDRMHAAEEEALRGAEEALRELASKLPPPHLRLFMFWLPVLLCLLGARFRDLYQLVPIVLQLVFLLSPILYKKTNLGALGWTATVNPVYQTLSTIRDTLMSGDVSLEKGVLLLIMNLVEFG